MYSEGGDLQLPPSLFSSEGGDLQLTKLFICSRRVEICNYLHLFIYAESWRTSSSSISLFILGVENCNFLQLHLCIYSEGGDLQLQLIFNLSIPSVHR